MPIRARLATGLAALCLAQIAPLAAHAQSQGFQLNRYEPTAPGEWSFWVDHPYYAAKARFTAGMSLNFASRPLIYGYTGSDGTYTPAAVIVSRQMTAHLELAASFRNRVLLSLALPVTLIEQGEPWGGATPANQAALGDPRLAVMARVFGQPYAGPISLSVGASLWFPLRQLDQGLPESVGDLAVRVMPKLVLGGLASSVLWSLSLGMLYRADATIGDVQDPAGRSAGNELQAGIALAYADQGRRFAIGPELVLATSLSGNAFRRSYSSVEALLGAHYNVARTLQLSAGIGAGLLRQPGTPDARGLFRLAYAPMPKAAPSDRDRDGVRDIEDHCPDLHPGAAADPERPGCPLRDQDGDGVPDRADLCPREAFGELSDRDRPGCPRRDSDRDGVSDSDDHCPRLAQGEYADPSRPGCPAGDSDRDGVVDPRDQCPEDAAGPSPDPARAGCPLPDRDRDGVGDAVDACVDRAGVPSPDPQKHGCPPLAEIREGHIRIVEPVFFATNRDVILQRSYPVLQAVASTILGSSDIARVRVEGHTDNRGAAALNQRLSERRARSVRKWLAEHGVAAPRLESQGFGASRPVAENRSSEGRDQNRRVDFVILPPSKRP